MKKEAEKETEMPETAEVVEKAEEEIPEPEKEAEPEPVYMDPDVAPAAIAFAFQTEREKTPLPIDDPEPVPEVQPEKPVEAVQEEPPAKEIAVPVPAKKEEPEEPPAEKEPVKEVKAEPSEKTVQDVQKNEEYERSVGNSTTSAVTIEVFEEDKKDILSIINRLDTVMKNRDYKTWLTYLDEESISYWSSRSNLAKAESRLPVKGLQLRNLEDYFKYVFIPSRSGRRVDEIRYESDRQVKAVQVNGSTDVVYYNFEKNANGVWKLHLPSNSD